MSSVERQAHVICWLSTATISAVSQVYNKPGETSASWQCYFTSLPDLPEHFVLLTTLPSTQAQCTKSRKPSAVFSMEFFPKDCGFYRLSSSITAWGQCASTFMSSHLHKPSSNLKLSLTKSNACKRYKSGTCAQAVLVHNPGPACK